MSSLSLWPFSSTTFMVSTSRWEKNVSLSNFYKQVKQKVQLSSFSPSLWANRRYLVFTPFIIAVFSFCSQSSLCVPDCVRINRDYSYLNKQHGYEHITYFKLELIIEKRSKESTQRLLDKGDTDLSFYPNMCSPCRQCVGLYKICSPQ